MKRHLVSHDIFSCCIENCNSQSHKDVLVDLFLQCKYLLLQSTENFRYINEQKFKIIPGWNVCVREAHFDARKCFLQWIEKGKPLGCSLHDKMKLTRSKFKHALYICKSGEKEYRNSKLVESLDNKDYKSFW